MQGKEQRNAFRFDSHSVIESEARNHEKKKKRKEGAEKESMELEGRHILIDMPDDSGSSHHSEGKT